MSSTTLETLGGRTCRVERHPGQGRPVVFTNGCGLPRHYWHPVSDRLARPATLFDRPGIDSPWPGTIPTLDEEVETLRELLVATPDAVLVAHSMAALHAEALLLRHPGSVAGLVLVDPSVEWTRRPSWAPRLRGAGHLMQRLGRLPLFTRLFAGAAVLGSRTQAHAGLDAEQRRALASTYRSGEAQAMAVAEYLAYRSQANDLLAWRQIHTLTPVPTTVLTATAHPSAAETRHAAHLGAHHVVIADSGHLLMSDAPRAVLAAITNPGGNPR